MTDKEQIKSYERAGCKHYCLGECSREFGNTNGNCVGTIKCIDNLIEQLARKTQEGEELKKQLDKQVKDSANRYSELNREWNNRCKKYADDLKSLNRYRKALEEIEGLATNLRTRIDYHSVDEVNADIDNVLNIINKAKGEE